MTDRKHRSDNAAIQAKVSEALGEVEDLKLQLARKKDGEAELERCRKEGEQMRVEVSEDFLVWVGAGWMDGRRRKGTEDAVEEAGEGRTDGTNERLFVVERSRQRDGAVFLPRRPCFGCTRSHLCGRMEEGERPPRRSSLKLNTLPLSSTP